MFPVVTILPSKTINLCPQMETLEITKYDLFPTTLKLKVFYFYKIEKI